MTESPTSTTAGRAGHSHVKQTLKNIVSNWGGYVFSIVVTFFLSPFVVHHLGNSAYGVWVLMVSLTGYLGLLDLGVRGAVTRYVAKFHTLGNHEEASRVASSSIAIFSAAGAVAVLLAGGLAVGGVRHFAIPEIYSFQAQVVLTIAGLTVATSLISGVFGGILIGVQRFDLVNLVEILSSGLRALVIVLALRSGQGIVTLALIQLAFSVATGLTNLWMVSRLYPQLRIRIGLATRAHFGLIFSFSLYSFLLQVFSYLILYTDAVVIGIFLPVSAITFFSIAGNLIDYSRGLTRGISSAITPLASRLEAEGNLAGLQRVTLNTAGYAAGIIMPIGLTFVLRGSTFIGLWMGAEYAKLSGQVLWVLSLSALFAAGPGMAWAVMFGISKHKALVPVYLVEALSNLVLSIILVRKMGIVGVAWGTTIPNLAVDLLFWPWYLHRTLKLPIRSYVLSAWGRPGLAMVPFVLGTLAFERWRAPANVLTFFVQVGLTLPLAIAGFWFLCVPAEDRESAVRSVRQAIGGLFQGA
jgi:O-antigen/teichoic acid export membrane protein